MRPTTSLLDEFPWQWLLFWLLLPNLLVFAMWPVGGPPMQIALLASGLAALLGAALPWTWAKRALIAVMSLAMASYYITTAFNLSPVNIDLLPPFLREVRPLRSPEYVLGGAIVLASMVLAMVKAPRVKPFASGMSWLLAVLSVFAVMHADSMATEATRGSYRRLPEAGTPFASAAALSGIDKPAGDGRNVVIILVEALGVPTGEVERSLFDADWNRPEWAQRFKVSEGTSPFFGTTTNGELRELCGEWTDYPSFDFAKAETCLPGVYQAAGYEAQALHSFKGSFYARDDWYPKLGFDRISFAPELLAEGASPCGGVFTGACDADIPALIGKRLKASDKPQLVYWLTLNTHLPVLAAEALDTEDCALGPKEWNEADPQICRLFKLHHDLADALDAMAMDPALPPTDFLIVGDHLPPFFDRGSRMRFASDSVPWVLLSWKPAK